MELEPEVDLSSFLARQRLEDDDATQALGRPDEDEEDVDRSLAYLATKVGSSGPTVTKKGRPNA